MLYRLISLFLFPLWIVHGWRHGKQRGRQNYLQLRLARALPVAPRHLTWFHAASVGEVEAITPLARHYIETGKSLIITSFTASGLATIERNFGDSVVATVIPIDSPGSCKRFFDHFDIHQGLILETELWPELLRYARQRKIPIVLANARLSAKSTGNFLVRSILFNASHSLSKILCRNQSDKDHFLQLGVDSSKIEVIGNLKAVGEKSGDHPPLVEGSYLLLASSHDPEETEFLRHRPDDQTLPLLVIAPRHPERSSSLQKTLQRLEIPFAVRSLNQEVDEETRIYLADTLGELTALMQHAAVVLMGGSFEGSGGHNLHEPARLGCAIITGPSDSNIKEDIDWLQPDKGIIQVTSMQEAWQETRDLLDNPARARALGDHARRRSQEKNDILSLYIAAINKVFDQQSSQA